MEVLKKMKMTMGLENGTVDEEKLRRARNMVPRALQSFVDDLASKGADTYNTSMLRVCYVSPFLLKKILSINHYGLINLSMLHFL